MRWFRRTLTAGALVAFLSIWSLGASAQMPSAPASKPKAPAAAPMRSSAQMPKSSAPAPTIAHPRQRVVIVEPIRVFDPFFDYPYPYAYAPDYMAENFGYVKLDSKMKDASVYVDGGYADKLEKAKKFALRPGTHNIELRDSDGRPIFKERVAVLVGKTTTLHVG
jgi:hypothetical protein